MDRQSGVYKMVREISLEVKEKSAKNQGFCSSIFLWKPCSDVIFFIDLSIMAIDMLHASFHVNGLT